MRNSEYQSVNFEYFPEFYVGRFKDQNSCPAYTDEYSWPLTAFNNGIYVFFGFIIWDNRDNIHDHIKHKFDSALRNVHLNVTINQKLNCIILWLSKLEDLVLNFFPLIYRVIDKTLYSNLKQLPNTHRKEKESRNTTDPRHKPVWNLQWTLK